MDIHSLYKSKLTTPAEAVHTIPSGVNLSMGLGAAQPPALLGALAKRAEAGEVSDLNIYYMEASRIAAETVLRHDLSDKIRPHGIFLTSVDRELRKKMREAGRNSHFFIPTFFHQVPRVLTESVKIDTFLLTVSPMDKHGYFSLGVSNDYTSIVCRSARRLIIEVNENMPRVFGGGAVIHVSEVDAIVEHNAPLFEAKGAKSKPEDELIGKTIASLIPDGACLQMGIGGLPNYICSQLKDKNDLGIHTEMLIPGMIDLIDAGVVNNKLKALHQGKTIFTFALGQKAMYDFLDDNPAIESYPVSYVNDPRIIAQNDKVFSVNATIQVDLMGACNSEFMMGDQYTGTGGQLDFVRGAYASKGGKSIIACASTASGGERSRIVPILEGPVTTPRNDTHLIVTEYGVADLKGKTLTQRAEALISIAHPKFRDELSFEAKKIGLI